MALHARRSPLFLNQGYPLTLEEEIELRLPPGIGEATLPTLRESVPGPLRWSARWTAPSAGTVRARLEVRLASGELTLEETRAFQKQLAALFGALAEGPSVILRGARRGRHPEGSGTRSFASLRMTVH